MTSKTQVWDWWWARSGVFLLELEAKGQVGRTSLLLNVEHILEGVLPVAFILFVKIGKRVWDAMEYVLRW